MPKKEDKDKEQKEDKEPREERRYMARGDGEKAWTPEERNFFEEQYVKMRPYLNRHRRELEDGKKEKESQAKRVRLARFELPMIGDYIKR